MDLNEKILIAKAPLEKVMNEVNQNIVDLVKSYYEENIVRIRQLPTLCYIVANKFIRQNQYGNYRRCITENMFDLSGFNSSEFFLQYYLNTQTGVLYNTLKTKLSDSKLIRIVYHGIVSIDFDKAYNRLVHLSEVPTNKKNMRNPLIYLSESLGYPWIKIGIKELRQHFLGTEYIASLPKNEEEYEILLGDAMALKAEKMLRS
jgi:hypothetical protein